jgi:endonuclease/exonuclease/phosphatase family metal-dependent hydrolase
MPAFVTGDFNISEQSDPYNIMTRDGLSDAKYAAESSMSYGTFHGYNPGNNISTESPIDYIFFTDNNFIINNYKVLVNGGAGQYTSDHYPVLIRAEQI